jgi:ribosome biogenesis GTPase
MSEDRKEQLRERARRAAKHLRTHAEEKTLKEARRARAHERAPREPDGDDDFQKMRRRERVLGPPRRPHELPATATARATVVALARGRVRVLGADGERPAVLAPHLAMAQQTEVAVGDQVLVHERPGGEPLVVEVLPRRSELARSDPHVPRRRRVLAANVDVVVLVLNAERLRAGLIDRLAVAITGSGASLAVCVNKCDLPHDEGARDAALLPHRRAGIAAVVVSALRGDGFDELQALVRGRACAFVGHSGVGKSTLLNRLDPAGARRTAAVRDRDGRGRHTTSASFLRRLDDGTVLIDTPGVRAFGLDDGETDAAAAFPEIAALAAGCRFRDCSHAHEPRCAVRAAVEQGALDASRYAAFLRLAGR